MTILGGSIPSAVLSIYLFSGYVFCDSLMRKKILQGVAFLAVTLGFSALICLPKLLPLYVSMVNSPRLAAPVFSDPRFGIVSFYNVLSCFIPVKYYFSLYIGELAIIAFVYAVISRRIRIDSTVIMCVLSAWLLISDKQGNPSLLRLLAHQILPLTSLIRLEFMYWCYPTIFAILYLSRYIDSLLLESSQKRLIVSVIVFDVLLTALFFLEYDTVLFWRAYGFHIAFSLVFLVLLTAVKSSTLRTALLAVLLVIECAAVFNRVNIDEPPAVTENQFEVAITDQNYIDQSFRNNELVSNKWKIWITDDRLRPTMSDSVRWPYLVPIPGGNPPNFAESMNLKQFAGWWYNTQEKFDSVRLKEGPALGMLEKMPLFGLYGLETGRQSGVASFDRLTCSSFEFTVNTTESGFLLLRQMYDKRWKVFVDDIEGQVFREEDFFMGVKVPTGEHKIRFLFRDRLFGGSVLVSIMAFAGILIIVAIRSYAANKNAAATLKGRTQ
jgi:hypothetical protein